MGLLGGASALALLGGSQASAAPTADEVNLLQPARSFAELLEPIPDAEKVLRAENERSNDAGVDLKKSRWSWRNITITTTIITIITTIIITIIITTTITIITTTTSDDAGGGGSAI